MTHLKIDTLLFQGQVVTSDFFAQGGDNQILIELRNQRLFDSIIKIDKITEDGTESIYVNDYLTNLMAQARLEYAQGVENEEQ
jgi:hypothetical protein